MQIRNFRFTCCPGHSAICIIMGPVKTKRATDSPFSYSLFFASDAFARNVERLAAECWKPSGLTPRQGSLLLHILNTFYAFGHFISADLRLYPSSVSRLADQLEKKGLIIRSSSDHLTYFMTTRKAEDMEDTLIKCDHTFTARCAHLFGEQNACLMSKILNRAADRISDAIKNSDLRQPKQE
jgi:DNA-binding MarR family transcriptional regulator